MENRAFKVAGIKNLIRRNYKVDPSILDIHALIDNKISMSENWFIIKPKVIILSKNKNRGI